MSEEKNIIEEVTEQEAKDLETTEQEVKAQDSPKQDAPEEAEAQEAKEQEDEKQDAPEEAEAQEANEQEDENQDTTEQDEEYEEGLPRNIVSVGKPLINGKQVYISQNVYKEIHSFTKNKVENESGGILLGKVKEAFGKTYILIEAFVVGKYCEATPTTLTFTHKTWDYIHKTIEKKYSDLSILGWFHTHPDYGIFLSDYDIFVQENFFSGENQIAYVIDPIKVEEGIFWWKDGAVSEAGGFYVFDEVGKTISIKEESSEEGQDKSDALDAKKASTGRKMKILIAFMLIVILALVGWCAYLSMHIIQLENQMNDVIEAVNYLFSIMMFMPGA